MKPQLRVATTAAALALGATASSGCDVFTYEEQGFLEREVHVSSSFLDVLEDVFVGCVTTDPDGSWHLSPPDPYILLTGGCGATPPNDMVGMDLAHETLMSFGQRTLGFPEQLPRIEGTYDGFENLTRNCTLQYSSDITLRPLDFTGLRARWSTSPDWADWTRRLPVLVLTFESDVAIAKGRGTHVLAEHTTLAVVHCTSPINELYFNTMIRGLDLNKPQEIRASQYELEVSLTWYWGSAVGQLGYLHPTVDFRANGLDLGLDLDSLNATNSERFERLRNWGITSVAKPVINDAIADVVGVAFGDMLETGQERLNALIGPDQRLCNTKVEGDELVLMTNWEGLARPCRRQPPKPTKGGKGVPPIPDDLPGLGNSPKFPGG